MVENVLVLEIENVVAIIKAFLNIVLFSSQAPAMTVLTAEPQT